jgi:hypothetical protein
MLPYAILARATPLLSANAHDPTRMGNIGQDCAASERVSDRKLADVFSAVVIFMMRFLFAEISN